MVLCCIRDPEVAEEGCIRNRKGAVGAGFGVSGLGLDIQDSLCPAPALEDRPAADLKLFVSLQSPCRTCLATPKEYPL